MTTYTLIFWTVTTVNAWGHPTQVLQKRTFEYPTLQQCYGTVEAIKPKAWTCIRREAI
jgi:hypothetical protein